MGNVILLCTRLIADPNDFGIGGLVFAGSAYCRALVRAGGNPLVAGLGDPEVYAELANGLVLTGGRDWNPARYGAKNEKNISWDDQLDEMDLRIFEAFYKRKKPILGICRGIQSLNVALGGTLYQDIHSELETAVHKAPHPVKAVSGSRICELFGEEFMTNTQHHQAVKDCGMGLRATAVASDGVIEAVEHESLPIFGVQWHPERMIGEENFKLENMMPLFEHFVKLCKGEIE